MTDGPKRFPYGVAPFHPALDADDFTPVAPDPYKVHRRLVAKRADRAELLASHWGKWEHELAELAVIVELFP